MSNKTLLLVAALVALTTVGANAAMQSPRLEGGSDNVRGSAPSVSRSAPNSPSSNNGVDRANDETDPTDPSPTDLDAHREALRQLRDLVGRTHEDDKWGEANPPGPDDDVEHHDRLGDHTTDPNQKGAKPGDKIDHPM